MIGEITSVLCALTLVFYFWIQWKWTYWTKRGIYQPKPMFPFGTFYTIFTQKMHMAELFEMHAKETEKLPMYGGYFLASPTLVIRDADLVRDVLVKDFEHFVDRAPKSFMKMGKSNNRNTKIWFRQMTNASGQDWKDLRSTFSPIFTSGKMKAMLVFMHETCNQLIKGIEKYEEKNEDFEIKDLLGRYSMDTIASCAFGVNAESFINEKSKFVEYAKNLFLQRAGDAFKMIIFLLPGGYHILNALNVSLTKDTETDFFYQAILSSLNHRRQENVRRNDLIDLMLDAIKGEGMEEDVEDEDQFHKDAKLNHTSAKKNLDELSIVATAMVFLVAGYETTGTTLAYALYEMSKNPEVQEKLHSEIENILNGDPNKEISYDDLLSMTYLDQVLNETLRFHTPGSVITRSCNKDYKIPNSEVTVQKDDSLWINVMALHFDPKHYENPNVFDPEHFSKEAKAKRHQYAFMPFGLGPRGCIGMRFALLEAKLALANIVRKFVLKPSSKTTEPIVLDPKTAFAYPKDGLFINVQRR